MTWRFDDWLIRVTLTVSGVVVLGVLGLGAFFAIDLIGVAEVTTAGTVADISFQAEHMQSGGKTSRLVPDTWFLDVQTTQGEDWLAIHHAPWGWQAKGSVVRVRYTRGRLTGWFSVSWVSCP